MSEELLKSVKEVFKEGKHYNIPEYQRGYKWTSQNAKTLLDDLAKFEEIHNQKGDSSFYCLQNITLVPTGTDSYNVVDGQQRLTTLYILLSYLKKKGQLDDSLFSPDCLQYSVRKETHTLLKEHVATGKIWDASIKPYDAKHKDQWYILDVAKGIQEWFEDNAHTHTFVSSTITDHLKLIVNDMTEGNENDIFAGLNGGKVDLDGADLVRAELITRAAREKYHNLDPNKVGEFRVHIGLVLDEMVKWWSDSDHYAFFNQMLPNDKDTEDFSNDYKINTLYRLYFEAYKTDKDKDKFGFRFFENGHDINRCQDDNHYELYASLIAMHNTLKDWYNFPKMYHWIGYVFFNFKQFPEVSFAGLWKLWNESDNKQDFLCEIKQWILSLVAKRCNLDASSKSGKVDKENIKSVWEGLLKDVDDLSYDWYHDDFLDELLILIEILWIEKNGYKNRLKVSYLRQNKENREHIRSCCPNENEGKENRSREDWLHFVKEAYNSDKDAEIRKNLLNLLDSFDEQLTDDNISHINKEMNEYAQNSIGNLVLLGENVNKSYGNALFRNKVKRIIEENAKNVRYIRPYTFDIFLQKVNSDDPEWRWSQEDIKKTIERSRQLLDDFLNSK